MRVARLTNISGSPFLLPSLSRGTRERAGPLPKPRAAFSGDHQGVKRAEAPVHRMAGEPKPVGAAKRKQKPAVLQGAARPVCGR